MIGVYPESSHDIPGVRSLIQLQQTALYRPDEYDAQVEVTNRESYDMCLRLNREESIIAGPSSGMALIGAIKTLPDEPGTVAVIIFPDNVFKYASSFQRHFPQHCPSDAQDGGDAQSESATAGGLSPILVAEMMENLKNPYDTIKVKDLSQRLETTARPDDTDKLACTGKHEYTGAPVIIDIRPTDMYAESRIAGSINIPRESLADRTNELPEVREADIVMVCGIGKFSKGTVLYLKSMGYRNVRSLKGGLNEWLRKGQALESTTAESP